LLTGHPDDVPGQPDAGHIRSRRQYRLTSFALGRDANVELMVSDEKDTIQVNRWNPLAQIAFDRQ